MLLENIYSTGVTHYERHIFIVQPTVPSQMPLLLCAINLFIRSAWKRKLTGKNLSVVWAKFTPLTRVVFVMSALACPHLELKPKSRFRLACVCP